MFVNYFLDFQKHFILEEWTKCKSSNTIERSDRSFIPGQSEFEFEIEMHNNYSCKRCGLSLQRSYVFQHQPPWLLIFVDDLKTDVQAETLPQELEVNGHIYRFLCCTFFTQRNSHFKGIYSINNSFYFFDDLNSKVLHETIPKHRAIICLYHLV